MLGVGAVLLMKRAKLKSTYQDLGSGIRFRHRLGHPQAIDGSVTAHESNLGSRTRRGQLTRFDDLKVDAWVNEARAGDRDEMGNFMTLDVGVLERFFGGRDGQLTRLSLKHGHALGRGGPSIMITLCGWKKGGFCTGILEH